MNNLEILVALSHEFGTADYVKGGGGNTSMKDARTLWVKPSGTTLAGLTPETFVEMNRARLDALYGVTPPADPAAREELIKNMMAAAVESGAQRPSVEAPLHNVFSATYVVHTHPALVNGLTCAMDGEAACQRLFPDALWVEYIDPGYTLCMAVRERLQQYKREKGVEPELVILQNHGLFIAADTADGIRALYARVMQTLRNAYTDAGIMMTLAVADTVAPAPETEATLRNLLVADAAYMASSGNFPCAPGPISPDHLVYAKAFPFTGPLTQEAVNAYKSELGYAPKVVVTGDHVYGIGTSQKNADLALELAQDGALVVQLAEAFGGIHYMSDAHRKFIENWEVESYRAQQV